MRRVFLSSIPLAFLLSVGHPALCQERSAAMEKLSFMVGEWVIETPADGQVGTDSCEWLGTAFLTCETLFTSPSGEEVRLLSVYGYDTAMERYTWVRYYSNGLIDDHIGWLDGDVWRWVQRDSAGGRFRLTVTDVTPTSYSLHWDRSVRGRNWEPYGTFSEGTARKTG